MIKTNKDQDINPYFKGFDGEVADVMVFVAKDVSAQLIGPSDKLKITLRGEKMRTILSPAPITWIWDVEPLKPGPAQVTLEVISHIKTANDTEPVPIRVLQDTWLVEARGIEWVKYKIQQVEPVTAFMVTIGGMLTGALAWFGIKGLGGKKIDFES